MPMPYTPRQVPLTAPTLTSTLHDHGPVPSSERGCKATITSPMSRQISEAPTSSLHHVDPTPAPPRPALAQYTCNPDWRRRSRYHLADANNYFRLGVRTVHHSSVPRPASRDAPRATHHFITKPNFGTGDDEDVSAAGLSCSQSQSLAKSAPSTGSFGRVFRTAACLMGSQEMRA